MGNGVGINKEIFYYKGDRQDMLRYVPPFSKRILEVGCGEGAFAQLLLNENREIWGVELNEVAAKKASEVLYKVYVDAIENVINDLPDKYFDLIIFNDVLEHLIDPHEVLAKIRQKLIIKGKIIASIPNLRFAKVMFNLIVKKDFTYTEMGILDSTHLRFFTVKTMRDLFRESGYQIDLVEGINQSRSFLAKAFVLLISLLTLRSNNDALFPQYVIIATTEDSKA